MPLQSKTKYRVTAPMVKGVFHFAGTVDSDILPFTVLLGIGAFWFLKLEQDKKKYKHTYKYREKSTEKAKHNNYDDPYQHVCTTPKVCTLHIIILCYYAPLPTLRTSNKQQPIHAS